MTDATVAIRNAVKPFLLECEAGDNIIVAVSGGADSLALAYAILKEATPLAVAYDIPLPLFLVLKIISLFDQVPEGIV